MWTCTAGVALCASAGAISRAGGAALLEGRREEATREGEAAGSDDQQAKQQTHNDSAGGLVFSAGPTITDRVLKEAFSCGTRAAEIVGRSGRGCCCSGPWKATTYRRGRKTLTMWAMVSGRTSRGRARGRQRQAPSARAGRAHTYHRQTWQSGTGRGRGGSRGQSRCEGVDRRERGWMPMLACCCSYPSTWVRSGGELACLCCWSRDEGIFIFFSPSSPPSTSTGMVGDLSSGCVFLVDFPGSSTNQHGIHGCIVLGLRRVGG